MGAEIIHFLTHEGLQLFLAIILGGLIGAEREIAGKPAGLRTTILICLGSTIFMMMSTKVAATGDPQMSDPARLAAGVVTGIGFIGAGAIMRNGGSVYGLTSAATIWVVGGLGIAIGCYEYTVAILTTVVILFVLRLLSPLECYINEKCLPKGAKKLDE